MELPHLCIWIYDSRGIAFCHGVDEFHVPVFITLGESGHCRRRDDRRGGFFMAAIKSFVKENGLIGVKERTLEL